MKIKNVLLGILILSLGLWAKQSIPTKGETPTKESKVQGVIEYDRVEISIPTKNIHKCTKDMNLIIYAKIGYIIPIGIEEEEIQYVNQGDEKGYRLCRDKKGNIKLIMASYKLYPKNPKERVHE